MRFFELYLSKHTFRHLPAFSRFLLEQHLDVLIREVLQLSREADLPLLRHLMQFSDEQLVEMSKGTMGELLSCLSDNKPKQYIERSLERWRKDNLGIVGQFEVMAEDITLLNYVRGMAFRKFIPLFTADLSTALELVEELDSFFSGFTTAATNAYIDLLKQRIARQHNDLLEAQRIALTGSFELNLATMKAECSPEIYRIFEVQPGTGFSALMEGVHPDDRDRVGQAMQKATDTGSYEVEHRYLKGGKLKYFCSKGIVLPGNGGPSRILGTVQDITERKRAEHELLEKTLSLERSNESLQQFAYVASHDLKEPIRKIATFTDVVLTGEPQLSEGSRQRLQKVHSSAVLARRMIDDIMAYSALTGWKDKGLCNLEDIVRQSCGALEQSIAEKNAVIEWEPLPEVTAVDVQMRQLFQNILSNALKFSRPEVPPHVSITCRWLTTEEVKNHNLPAAEKYLKTSVQDNGIGFNQQSSEKIFALFQRLHSRTTYEGNGLGLAIVKRIVDNHGGVIFARSEPGKGAIFTFILPQQDSSFTGFGTSGKA